MELPSKIFEQIAFNTTSRIEEHMLIVLDKSTHKEHLSQPSQTKNKQLKIAVHFLAGFNGIFNVPSKNNKFCFTVSIDDERFSVFSNPLGAHETESLNNEIKRIIIEDGYFTEATYLFTVKPNFSTFGSIVELSANINGPQIAFTPDDSIRD